MYVCVFWFFVLLLDQKNSQPKFILSLVFFFASLQFLGNFFIFHNDFEIFNWFDSLYIFATLFTFPLFYVYLKLITQSSKISKNVFYHFVPALFLSLVNLVLTFLMSQSEQMDYMTYYVSSDYIYLNTSHPLIQIKSYFNMINRLVFGIQVFYYIIRCNQLINRYKELIQVYYSNYYKRKIKWSNPFNYIVIITSITVFISNIIGKETFFEYSYLVIISSLIFTSMIFLIGYVGNSQSQTIHEIEYDLIKGEKMDDNLTQQPDVEFLQKLNQVMLKDEVYLDKDLKIWDLSLLLNIKKDTLIKMLKDEFKQDFNTFVNYHRILKAKRLINSTQKLTIQEISEKSGYYSVAEFLITYKKFEKKFPVIS